jgi:hypothetical protein
MSGGGWGIGAGGVYMVGRDTSASRVRRQRSVTSKVDSLEREYMEAAAAAAADAVVVDSVTVKLELQRAQAAALPTHRATGQLHGHRPPVLVLPLPATALATRWAHAGGRLHQQCRKEHRCVAAILSFWSVPSRATSPAPEPEQPQPCATAPGPNLRRGTVWIHLAVVHTLAARRFARTAAEWC